MEELKINIIRDSTGKIKSSTIVLKGMLTFSQAEKLKNLFISNFLENECLRIEMRKPIEIDLSYIQILYSLIKSVKASRKTVAFKFYLSTTLAKDISNAGFNILQQNLFLHHT